MKLENPTAQIGYYGYDSDELNSAGEAIMVPLPGTSVEAHKTEPDKNTYLVFKKGLHGADPSYNYGTHFLFQGHESGTPGYVTRINLDADAAHRVTLLATVPTGDIDGITWDPWAKRLLLTTENSSAPTYAMTPDYPGTVTDLSGSWARAGTKGSRTTPPATSGSPRTSAVPRSRTGGATPRPRSPTATCSASCRPAPATWPTASSRCCRRAMRPGSRSPRPARRL